MSRFVLLGRNYYISKVPDVPHLWNPTHTRPCVLNLFCLFSMVTWGCLSVQERDEELNSFTCLMPTRHYFSLLFSSVPFFCCRIWAIILSFLSQSFFHEGKSGLSQVQLEKYLWLVRTNCLWLKAFMPAIFSSVVLNWYKLYATCSFETTQCNFKTIKYIFI